MKNWSKKITKLMHKNFSIHVIAINKKKNMYIEFISLKEASQYTNVNIGTISLIKRKKNKNKIKNWEFYFSYEEINQKPKKFDCELHKVNLAKNVECPLCKLEKSTGRVIERK